MKLIGIVAILVLIGGCAKTPSPSPKPVVHSLVGNWKCINKSGSNYMEGLAFNDKGQFARWGSEAEGGWSSGGTYKLVGDKVKFETKEDSYWTYSPNEYGKKGEATITWHSPDAIDLNGPKQKDSFERLPDPKKQPRKGEPGSKI